MFTMQPFWTPAGYDGTPADADRMLVAAMDELEQRGVPTTDLRDLHQRGAGSEALNLANQLFNSLDPSMITLGWAKHRLAVAVFDRHSGAYNGVRPHHQALAELARFERLLQA